MAELLETATMARRRNDSKLQRRKKNKELKRQARRKAKDDSDLLSGNDRKGLNFPKKAENGLNFPKKAENGLNFPKKAENGLNFPKKAENGLNFPKKSENGLNFPKKADIVEDVMPCLMPCPCTETDAKRFADSVTETYTDSRFTFAKCFPNECLNVGCDFEETFADAYPNDIESRNSGTHKDLSCNEEVIIQNTDIESIEVSPYNRLCSDFFSEGMDTENPVITQPNPLLWNANQIMFGSFHQNDNRFPDQSRGKSMVFGSFHQNDARFSEQSRGYQCTCNAACMLAYSISLDVEKSSVLDKVLCEGDTLYQSVITKLKADGKFIHHLLSLEEIPDDFKVDTGKFTFEKLPIVCGVLVDSQNHGLPTLHSALQSAFLSVSSGLLTIGAICSAIFRKNGSYVFFDSHSHGENGLSSCEGASCLINFSNLDGLVSYLYAFYDSMKLDTTDTNLQFDFLPINVMRSGEKQSYKDQMESHMEAYFNDQKLRQANKSINESKKASGAKKRHLRERTEYHKAYKRKIRQNPAYKSKEREAMRSARKDPVYKTKEREAKQSVRKDPLYKTKEREAMRSVRKDPVYKTKEREAMRSVRKDPVYKTKEREAKQSVRKDPLYKTREREAMRSVRKDPLYKTKEREAMRSVRKDPVYKTKEREAKQFVRKDPVYKSKEREAMRSVRKDPVYKTKEREAKQFVRKDPVYKSKEREAKQSERENQTYKAQEKINQNMSKRKARKNP